MKNDKIDILSNEMKKAIIDTCFDEIMDYLYKNRPITIIMSERAKKNIEDRWRVLNQDNKISYNQKIRSRWIGATVKKIENGCMTLVGNYKNAELLYSATTLHEGEYTIGQIVEGSYLEEKYVDYRLELIVKYEDVIIDNFIMSIE